MIGIELTGNRIRVADVRGKGSAARAHASWTDLLPTELVASKAEQLGKWLKEKLKAAGIGGGDAVVLLGRGITSVKSIRVPVVPDHELPQIVSFTVEGTTSQIGETIVDYQSGPIHASNSSETGDELEVFTAVVTAETLDVIRKMLAKAGLNPKRIGLRAFGYHAILPRSAKSNECDLVLYASEDSIEVSVWTGDQLRLNRSIPLVRGALSPARCVNEIRRTLASFHSLAEQENVDRLTLLGGHTDEIAAEAREATSLQINEFGVSDIDVDLLAVVGGAGFVDDKSIWPIDFLRPKKAVAQANQKRTMALVGALVLVIVGGGGFFVFRRELDKRDRQLASLNAEIAQLTSEINEFKPTTERHEVIKQWVGSGDMLLDELQEVAAALPDTSDLILTGLEYNAGQNDQPGTIKLDGLSRDQSIVTQAQTQLASTTDKKYDVIPRGLDPGADVGAFVWRFGLDLTIDPLSITQYAARADSRNKALERLSPPVDMVRNVISLAHQAVTSGSKDSKVANKDSKEERKAEKREAKAEAAGSGEGESVLDKKVAEIMKLPADQREAEISKVPKFLQKRVRAAIKKAGG
jgi:Tfp pilus assembly PilM family ATPase